MVINTVVVMIVNTVTLIW